MTWWCCSRPHKCEFQVLVSHDNRIDCEKLRMSYGSCVFAAVKDSKVCSPAAVWSDWGLSEEYKRLKGYLEKYHNLQAPPFVCEDIKEIMKKVKERRVLLFGSETALRVGNANEFCWPIREDEKPIKS